MEYSLVFCSDNITFLSNTLIFFHNAALKPLKWIHPLIFNLPEKLLAILDSPVPVLVGINRDF
jgi:hypothetical protein